VSSSVHVKREFKYPHSILTHQNLDTNFVVWRLHHSNSPVSIHCLLHLSYWPSNKIEFALTNRTYSKVFYVKLALCFSCNIVKSAQPNR